MYYWAVFRPQNYQHLKVSAGGSLPQHRQLHSTWLTLPGDKIITCSNFLSFTEKYTWYSKIGRLELLLLCRHVPTLHFTDLVYTWTEVGIQMYSLWSKRSDNVRWMYVSEAAILPSHEFVQALYHWQEFCKTTWRAGRPQRAGGCDTISMRRTRLHPLSMIAFVPHIEVLIARW